MEQHSIPLSYKGHPLRRKDNLIYYGTMAEKYIIMLQILDDGRVAISGVFLYWLDEKDMDGLRAIFDHLNTIYD